ncbi:MAG: hypothetical protein WCF79_16525 [Rhodomicrobium sp.]
MAVTDQENQDRFFNQVTITPRTGTLIGSPVPRAARESEASERGDGARMLEVMCDPYEWKSAVRVALVIFVGFLALAPALAPDQKKLAAEINYHTLKAAAAIKSSTKIASPPELRPAAPKLLGDGMFSL